MKLRIYKDQLDSQKYVEHDYECLLKEWMQIREQFPLARIYKDSICTSNDVTPKTKQDALDMLHADGDYFVVCHAKGLTPVEWFYVVSAVLSLGAVIYTMTNMPEIGDTNTTGSSNNSLASRQNKFNVNGRTPDIYGTVKSTPNLLAPVYRYYKDNVQTEECLLVVCRQHVEVSEDDIYEGETPINTIAGASLSLYAPNQSLLDASPQVQIGETFTTKPLVTKQVGSVDGKQTLLSPNSAKADWKGVTVTSSGFGVMGDPQNIESVPTWIPTTPGTVLGSWTRSWVYKYADFTEKFSNGEQIIIENAIFGEVEDASLSGNTQVDVAGTLTVTSNKNINSPDAFKKIRVVSLLVNDATNGQLDLAGEYSVDSITKTANGSDWDYLVTLSSDFASINPNFSLLTANTTGVMSGVLTDNNDNIDLSGTYTLSTVSEFEIGLVNPSSVNSDWNRVNELTDAQKADFYQRSVTFKGAQDNWIGWYYAGSQDSTGLLLNFVARSGIFQGDNAKFVGVEAQWQMVVDGVPTGEIYNFGDVMQGKANDRNPIGLTIKQDLPQAGKFRFRVKRENDNGDSSSLIDDVTFESAYSFYETERTTYDQTMVRLKRLAIGSGTNASELNMLVTSKLYSYATGEQSLDRIATNDFADILVDMSLDSSIGRKSLSQVDTDALYALSDEIETYFGTAKACEFNYTFDNANSSFEELVATLANAVFCTGKDQNNQLYMSFEKKTPNSLILFNHRNMKPESMKVTETFGMRGDYNGIDLKWRDASDGYAEKSIKLPDDYQSNYQTIEIAGVTNNVQAHFHAMRAWNKLKHARKNIEFTGYGETSLVDRNQRIAVVDSTIPKLTSGEIVAQDNLVLTLDCEIELDNATAHMIHLQLSNGQVDVIAIDDVVSPIEIQLARIPLIPLVTSGVANATYSIVEASQQDCEAYLIEEKGAGTSFEASITAVNYSDLYYSNDTDFINGLVS